MLRVSRSYEASKSSSWAAVIKSLLFSLLLLCYIFGLSGKSSLDLLCLLSFRSTPYLISFSSSVDSKSIALD